MYDYLEVYNQYSMCIPFIRYVYIYIWTVCIRDRVALRCQTSTSHLRYPLVFAAAVCFEDGEVAVASVP